MKELFEQLINTGVENLEMVEPKDKSMVCAELAKAIAMSGLLSERIVTTIEEDTKEPKAEEKTELKKEKKTSSKSKAAKSKAEKEALKPEAGKGKKVAEEPVAEEPQEPEVPQEEAPAEIPAEVPQEEVVTEPAAQNLSDLDEWTEALQVEKREQLETLEAYTAAWGEEYVYNDCLSAFTNGVLTGPAAVRPSNIDGFVVYLQQLAEQFSNQ